MINIVNEFKQYANDIPNKISQSYYKSEFFAKELGLKMPTYYRRLRENNFTIDEISKITEILYPEEFIMMKLQQSENDYKEGKTKTSAEVRKLIRQKAL